MMAKLKNKLHLSERAQQSNATTIVNHSKETSTRESLVPTYISTPTLMPNIPRAVQNLTVHPQLPTVDYSTIEALQHEYAFKISQEEFFLMIALINMYLYSNKPLEADKISRHDFPIPYSILVLQGHFIISYHLKALNEEMSYIYGRRKIAADQEIPQKEKETKKPILFDIGYDLTNNSLLFIKEYPETGINTQASIELREERRQRYHLEYENMTSLRKPCLFGIRNDNKFYVAQPFVQGDDFFMCMDQKKITPLESLQVYSIITQKILQMHKEGWLHLDAKTENFMITREQNHLNVEAVDYQTFRRIDTVNPTTILLGSEATINPDWHKAFAQGKTKYSTLNDIYALNTMLIEIAQRIYARHPSQRILNIIAVLQEKTRLPIEKCYSVTALSQYAGLLKKELESSFRSGCKPPPPPPPAMRLQGTRPK